MLPKTLHRMHVAVLICASAAAALGAGSVAAQTPYTVAPVAAESPSDAMHKLATQPKDLAALLAAGRASLDLGDMQAAAGFFGRAEEYYPASPAAKIGIGAAMTLMGDARGAMTYFDKASALRRPGARRGPRDNRPERRHDGRADHKRGPCPPPS
jgi:cytochrome c-type biogenesis protein CcmH/NrfG